MPFAFHVTPWAPPLFYSTFHTFSEYQSVRPFFSVPSRLRPEDLTFKWQLFSDLFRKLPSCLVLPAGTRSEAPCLTESVSRENSHVGASFGNMSKTRVVCQSQGANFSSVQDVHSDEACQRVNVNERRNYCMMYERLHSAIWCNTCTLLDVLTQEGDTDFTEGAELKLVGRLQQRLCIGRVDDQRSRVDELKKQLQHVGADVAHA